MKKQILFLIFNLLVGLPTLAVAASSGSNEGKQILSDDLEWRIGGKIHFEEESGLNYLGIKEINKAVRGVLKKIINIDDDTGSENAKIFLKRDRNKIQLTHFEEKSRPGVGEEMHATLLYTQPRGFYNSETLKQVCANLFEKCDFPPTIEEVAARYSSIIKPEWEFKISEVVLTRGANGASFVMAKLLFENQERLFNHNKPISAGLHMTLVNFEGSILTSDEVSDLLLNEINLLIKGRKIKIAKKNGVADLEFGISGSSWRIRAQERIQWEREKT